MKTKIIIGVIIIIVSGFFLGLFLKERESSVKTQKPKPEYFSNVIEANNQFALDYYHFLTEKEKENIFFSPFSISSALAMTYEGAAGETAQEMRSVFYFIDEEARRAGYKELYGWINKTDKKYKLYVANALWPQENYFFLEDYFKTVEDYYGGQIYYLNYAKDLNGAVKTINNWVEEKTETRIKDIVSEDTLSKATKLVITNAVYFKGDWVKQFEKVFTKDDKFKVSRIKSIMVPMMQITGSQAEFKYMENKDLQILELPYSGEEISMFIFLPRKNNLPKLEKIFNIKNISNWKKNLKKQRVDVYIPKFKFESEYFMSEDLISMGITSAFSELNADFSKMSPGNLYIDEIIHKTFIEVNEEGTEAAAITAVAMGAGFGGKMKAPKVPVFRADHPFIFYIQENKTGNILFIGKIVDPSK